MYGWPPSSQDDLHEWIPLFSAADFALVRHSEEGSIG